MSDQKPVDREPRDTDAPLAIGGANSDLAGGPVGTKNRAHLGTDPDERPRDESAQDTAEGDGEANARSGQNPPVVRSQRLEESGDQLSSQQSAAAHKSGTLHEDGLAGQVEAAADDEHPTRDHTPGNPSDGSGRKDAGQR